MAYTEQQLDERGRDRVNVRLSKVVRAQLAELARITGKPEGTVVSELISSAYEKSTSGAKKSTRSP